MGYLFGDSTESGLEFNYLAFLREAVDCVVSMVECDVALATVADRRRAREQETEAELAQVAELGKRATEVVAPVARGKDKSETAVGRCAQAIATAIGEAVERESAAVRAKLAGQREELEKEALGVNTRAQQALEQLLRTHDLPGSDKEIDVEWTPAGVKATMRQRTSFGVEAVLALDIPHDSLFTPDLRVDRVADGVEVHALEAGGWIKKSDKLVAHKLGRYHVTSITIGATVRIHLRADTSTGEIAIISAPGGELVIDGSIGGTAREILIEDRDRPGLRAFVDKLEAATRALAQSRGRLVSVEIDGKPLAEPGNARLFCERLTTAIAPTVHKIKQHSRSSDELVLRRLLGDNRREETYVPVAELVQRFEVLPVPARSVFAPLRLQGEPPFVPPPMPREASEAKPAEARSGEARLRDTSNGDAKNGDAKSGDAKNGEKTRPGDAPAAEVRPVDAGSIEARIGESRAAEARPGEARPIDVKAPSVPMPDRTGSRTSPPQSAIPEPMTAAPRKKEPTLPFASSVDAKPMPPPLSPEPDVDDEEWPAISKEEASDKPVSSS